MPYSVDGIGPNLSGHLQSSQQMSNRMAQSLGFPRSYTTQAGTARPGANPATLQPARPEVAQGGNIHGVRETPFGNISADVVANTQMCECTAHRLGIQAVTGQLNDVHDCTIAVAEPQLTTELSSTIRNKVVDMFNETMRMQA